MCQDYKILKLKFILFLKKREPERLIPESPKFLLYEKEGKIKKVNNILELYGNKNRNPSFRFSHGSEFSVLIFRCVFGKLRYPAYGCTTNHTAGNIDFSGE